MHPLGRVLLLKAAFLSFHIEVFDSLISVTLPEGTSIEYVIDGMNRRAREAERDRRSYLQVLGLH